jgi:adenylate cyclase
MAEVDFEAEGLLKGTRGKARAGRLELLQQLHEAGVSLDELKRAVAEERLALLPVERVLAEEERYTAAEIAEKSGVDLDFVIEQQRALGLPVDPEARAYTEGDLEALRSVKQFLDAGMPREGLLEAGRVFGQSMARVAEAVRGIVTDVFVQPGDTERDLGLRQAEVARQLAPSMGPLLEHLYTRHLVDQIRREVIDRTQLVAGEIRGTRDVTVCFADLVGFTRLGELVDPGRLGTVAERLAALAGDVIEPPVRMVKTIGDAAMLVSPETEAAVDAALDLVKAADAEGEDFPQLRAGLAAGEALNRYGDWYGNPVNLASRVTGIAYPGSVLVAEDVREGVDEGRYAWSFAGEKNLKGIKRPVPLFRVRRPDPDEAS